MDPPTNGAGNRRGLNRVMEAGAGVPPTTSGNGTTTPGGTEGTRRNRRDGRTGTRGPGGGRPPPITRGIGHGTPGGGLGTEDTGRLLATLTEEALEGGGPPTYNLEHQHGIPPLPLGGGKGDFVTHCMAAARGAAGY